MLEPFLITFKEALKCTLIIAFILQYLKENDKEAYYKNLLTGLFTGFFTGFLLGYVPYLIMLFPDNKTWTFLSQISGLLIFYAGIFFVLIRFTPTVFVLSSGLWITGCWVFFFEARAAGFLIHDMGLMKGNLAGITAIGAAGFITGFLPLFFLRRLLITIPARKVFTLPSLLVLIGAFKLAFSGLFSTGGGDLLITLQKGFSFFLEGAVRHLQYLLLIPEHPFIRVPFAGLAGFLSGDRTAMALMVITIILPPLFVLINLFARPDPVLNSISTSSQRRLKIAFFREELAYLSIPVLLVVTVLIIRIHATNISMNPLYEPVPVSVRETEGRDSLLIPMSDKFGDITDSKLRKYVYYYGNKQIVFLAVLKPDGSVGVALDQCEICRPADWNQDAQGYAQKGDHLICKYCMTPIALPTLNNPGGCNPIPVAFRVEDNNIKISLNDLINTFNAAEELDKGGTHL